MKKCLLGGIFIMLTAGVCFNACSGDDLSSTSVVKGSVNEDNDFDLWLQENYNSPYNINFKYRYEDIEASLSYSLVPASTENSIMLAKMIKYLWLEPYEEVAGVSFIRSNVPRVMVVIGTVAYNSNKTFTLGTAEGGLKITLYAGNWIQKYIFLKESGKLEINVDELNHYYLKTIHHEFGHILHQKVDYPQYFKTISTGNYNGSSWNNRSATAAAKLGFVSSYAGSNFNDDFVETLAVYLTYSDAKWETLLKTAEEEGAATIRQKLGIVRDYMRDAWNIDLELLRRVLARRYAELYNINWFEL